MIYLASDIHGHIRLPWLQTQLNKIPLTPQDSLILLGDAGIVWSETEHCEVKEYYNALPCKTLFVDGNHENFSLLAKYPTCICFGGLAQKVSDKIFHLMRGEIYLIEGKKFFVFGGGFSKKKLTKTSPVFVWDEEMPNNTEYKHGLNMLKDIGNRVDFILSHVSPFAVTKAMGIEVCEEEKALNEYLGLISEETQFDNWYFGHYHKDFTYGKYDCLYERIITIGENI